MKREPIIHSYITDKLPADHLLAYRNVGCDYCGKLLHAANNECMRPWVETGKGNFCLPCFVLMTVRVDDSGEDPDFFVILDERWGLEDIDQSRSF